MGELIGGIFSGVGSAVGGIAQYNAEQQAIQAAQQGYNYLTSGPGAPLINNELANGNAATSAEAQLLGLTPMQPGTESAFDNYLKSTGYQFQQQQGQDAITTSAAARGLLNSGGTAKALVDYGQKLGSTYFGNYLSNLKDVGAGGYNADIAVANAAHAAATNAIPYINNTGTTIATGVGGVLGGIGNALASANNGQSAFAGSRAGLGASWTGSGGTSL